MVVKSVIFLNVFSHFWSVWVIKLRDWWVSDRVSNQLFYVILDAFSSDHVSSWLAIRKGGLLFTNGLFWFPFFPFVSPLGAIVVGFVRYVLSFIGHSSFVFVQVLCKSLICIGQWAFRGSFTSLCIFRLSNSGYMLFSTFTRRERLSLARCLLRIYSCNIFPLLYQTLWCSSIKSCYFCLKSSRALCYHWRYSTSVFLVWICRLWSSFLCCWPDFGRIVSRCYLDVGCIFLRLCLDFRRIVLEMSADGRRSVRDPSDDQLFRRRDVSAQTSR